MQPVTIAVAAATFAFSLAYLCRHFWGQKQLRLITRREPRPRHLFVCQSCRAQGECYNAPQPNQVCRSCYWQARRFKTNPLKATKAVGTLPIKRTGSIFSRRKGGLLTRTTCIGRIEISAAGGGSSVHSCPGDEASGAQENAIGHLEGD